MNTETTFKDEIYSKHAEAIANSTNLGYFI
jgi:hypothetical protein